MEEVKLMKTNYHTHTKRCGYAIGEDYEHVEAAIKISYKVLGFSDHCPYKELFLSIQRIEWDDFLGPARYVRG